MQLDVLEQFVKPSSGGMVDVSCLRVDDHPLVLSDCGGQFLWLKHCQEEKEKARGGEREG